MKGVKRMHPLSAEPPSESREGQGLLKETPDSSKDEGPDLLGFAWNTERDRDWIMSGRQQSSMGK